MSKKSTNLVDSYLESKQALFDYFGYVEDWVAIPIDDSRGIFWELTGEGHGDTVKYHEDAKELSDEKEDEGNYYEDEIYTQRHLPKWVYRGKDMTMVCVDTCCDGNKFLRIFDNDKEIK